MTAPDPRATPPIHVLMSDYDLDEAIAVAEARRRVAHAHKRGQLAGMWHDLTVKLAEARDGRRRLAEAVDAAMDCGQ